MVRFFQLFFFSDFLGIISFSVFLLTPALKKSLLEQSLKQDHSSRRDNNLIKSQRTPVKECMTYPKMCITLLNITLTEVFTTIKDKEFVQYLLQMRSPLSTYTSKKYYLFHRDKGHEIEECYIFKKEIKRLIVKCYLFQFVKRGFLSKKKQRRVLPIFIGTVVTHFWVPIKNKINKPKEVRKNNRRQKRSENSQKIGQGI